MKTFGTFFSFLFLFAFAVNAQPVFNSITDNAEGINRTKGQFEKFEVTIDLIATYNNPFVENEIDLEATFINLVSGNTYTVEGFYYEYFNRTCNPNRTETLVPTGAYSWKVRFSPNETGPWDYYLTCTDMNASSISNTYSFSCTLSTNPGFIVLADSPAEKRYFKFSGTGEQYFPMGPNLAWAKEWVGTDPCGVPQPAQPTQTCQYEDWIDALSINGGNYARIWENCYWGFSIERVQCTNILTPGNYIGTTGHPHNNMGHMADAYRLDKVFEFAEQGNVYIKLVLESHGLYNGVDWSNDYFFQQHPYAALTSPVGTPAKKYKYCFDVNNTNTMDLFKRRFRYIISRWGYSSNLMSWEIMNENGNIPGLDPDITQASHPTPVNNQIWYDPIFEDNMIQWNEVVAAYIKAADKHGHLITSGAVDNMSGTEGQNFFRRLFEIQDIDFTALHRYNYNWDDCPPTPANPYNDGITEPPLIDIFSDRINKMFDAVVSGTDVADKPTMMDEFGLGADNNYLNAWDRFGVDLHNCLWGSVFTGVSGAATPWNWDYLYQNNLYTHYKSLSKFTSQLSLLNQEFNSHIVPGNLFESYIHYNNCALVDIGTTDGLTRNMYLIGQTDFTIYGWVQNRGYDWENLKNNPQYHNYLQSQTGTRPPNINTPLQINPLTDAHGPGQTPLSLPNGYYKVDWYKCSGDGGLIKSEIVTSNTNYLALNYPMNTLAWDYAYIIKYLGASYPIFCAADHNDKAFVMDLNTDGSDELFLNNRCNLQFGSFKSVDLTNGVNMYELPDNSAYYGWFDEDDLIFFGEVYNTAAEPGKEIVLVNRSVSGYGVKVISRATGVVLNTIDNIVIGPGWLDLTDYAMVGDVNGDGIDELVMMNTEYNSGAAVRVLILNTGGSMYWYGFNDFNPGLQGWLDAGDKSFLNDVNGDGKDDLILVNTTYNSGAIRCIDFNTLGNLVWIDHVNNRFLGWMDAADKMFVEDINGNGTVDLVLVNTAYQDGAIYCIDILNNTDLRTIYHDGSFVGWMDECDKTFISDVDADGDNEIILVNTSGNSGLIRAIDLLSSSSWWWSYSDFSTGFGGWIDSDDKLLVGDINNNQKADLVFVNTTTNSGAVRVIEVQTATHLLWIDHDGSYDNWLNGEDENTNCQNSGRLYEEITDNENEVVFYPNPFSTEATVLLVNNCTICRLEIFNSLGQTILVKDFSDNRTEIKRGEIKSGLYFYTVRNENKIIGKGKVIVK